MLIVYDIETYPNIFSVGFHRIGDGYEWKFEISDRVHQGVELVNFLNTLIPLNASLVGYNNLHFDYPIVHMIYMSKGMCSVDDIYAKSQAIFESKNQFEHTVKPWEVVIPQIDLFKIHHFDNIARSTSLKRLEFNMQSSNIEDLPYVPGTVLNHAEKDELIRYMMWDITETAKFLEHSKEQLSMREELSAKYDKDFTNSNDTKIGSDYFIKRLEEAMPGSCYDSNRQKRQTIRSIIHLKDAVFPYVQFEQPEFQRICDWFKSQSITETKGVFENLHCTVDDFSYHFGSGGIHGSVESRTIHSDEDYIIMDWDVASYYPNIAIKNRVYPEHLSETFCDIYEDVYNQRKEHAKGTAGNAMLKLALNGVYGKSNSTYSPFYDPLYTMTITINGQLLLCMLAEQLIKIPGLEMIQINTDGLTIRVPRKYDDHVVNVAKWWEDFTQLDLERVDYSRMFIRDVNNYIAETCNSADIISHKRKGAYEYNVGWHQNHSQKVVAKVAEKVLVHGADIRESVINHGEFMDFMICAKAPRADRLMHGDNQIQNTSRLYVSTVGSDVRKISPPAKGYKVGQWRRANSLTDQYYREVITELQNKMLTPHGHMHPSDLDSTGLPWDERINTKTKGQYKERTTAICKGYQLTVANNIMDATNPINYDYYIDEVKKLVEPLL
jgi:hypothetical protein